MFDMLRLTHAPCADTPIEHQNSSMNDKNLFFMYLFLIILTYDFILSASYFFTLIFFSSYEHWGK